jgi:calcineurin-like phosphoesterase family protein
MNMEERDIVIRDNPEEMKNLIISFESLKKQDDTIIRQWNERVNEKDTVYFLGDFCFKNSIGGKAGEGTCNRADYYKNQLNGNIVFIRGNHDSHNGVKAIIECAVLETGGNSIFVQHRPPERKEEIPEFCNLVLCGHVHEKWKFKLVDDIPIVNVGLDVWNFYPVTINEILREMWRWLKSQKNNS